MLSNVVKCFEQGTHVNEMKILICSLVRIDYNIFLKLYCQIMARQKIYTGGLQ